MRHLFLPACFCLMTLSGSTGSDAVASLEPFSGAEANDAQALTQTAVQAAVQAAVFEQNDGQGPSPADATIETSAPSAIEETKLPIPRPAYAERVVSRSPREICDTLIEAAQSNDLPIPFFVHLLFQESGFRPNVVSRAGAQGIAQFMPETAATVGLANPFDPLQAITASARLLRDLAKQFGNLGLAAAAYNAGPRRIQDWLAKKGKLPEETQNYVKTITGRPAKTWMAAAPGSVALTVPRAAPCREAAGLIAANEAEHRIQVAATPVLHGKAMIAARARVKMARFGAEKTPTIMVAERSKPSGAPKDVPKDVPKDAPIGAPTDAAKGGPKGALRLASKGAGKGASGAASRTAQAGKAAKGAIQLAAASKKKASHKVRVSQR
ncbi:MAG TPA: lytic transglycosylase domain-containing protein [Pseudolabrys sp.]|nr:lytic transglycosylase domain-containing protein [Pseudolabrys sp.]